MYSEKPYELGQMPLYNEAIFLSNITKTLPQVLVLQLHIWQCRIQFSSHNFGST